MRDYFVTEGPVRDAGSRLEVRCALADHRLIPLQQCFDVVAYLDGRPVSPTAMARLGQCARTARETCALCPNCPR